MIVQIHRISGKHLDGPLPIEPDVNEWLMKNEITEDRLVKVTFHSDKVPTRYPDDYIILHYALIYYLTDKISQ